MKIYTQDAAVITLSQYQDPLLNHITTHMLEKLPQGKGKRLLDIGCGIGRTAFAAADLGFMVVGVDIESKAIRLAKDQAQQTGKSRQCRFFLGDIVSLKGLESASFDAIICSEVIEHVGNPHRIIDRGYGLLKKGGLFILSTPHDPSQWTILDDYAQHVRRFRIKDLKHLFRRFQILSLTTLGFPSMRCIMQVYDKIVRFGRFSHSGSWRTQKTHRSLYNALVSRLLYIDDLFANWNWGTTILIVTKKV